MLEAALRALGEERAEAIADALPAPRSLDTARLTQIGILCAKHVRPKVSARAAARFDELVALAERAAGAARDPSEAWQRDLGHAQRDREHGRGAIVVAALAAELARLDLLRAAPGAGPAAVEAAADAAARAVRLLGDTDDERGADLALVRALAAVIGAP